MIKRFLLLHIPCLLVILWAAILLLSTQREMLYAAQDLSGWQPLWTPDACLREAGGLLVWMAGWLTQSFYYPALGVLLLCVLWALGYHSLAWGLRLSASARWMALLPIFGLVAGICQTGYWLYTLRVVGFFFLPTLVYVWIGIACVIIRIFHIHHWSPLTCSLIGILMAEWICLLSPWCGLPSWHPFDGDPSMLYRPWYFFLVALLIPVVFAFFRKIHIPHWLTCVVLLACMSVTYFFSCYRNACFHAEIRQQQAFESAEWDELIREVTESPRTPTRQMVLLADAGRLHRDYHRGDSVTFAGNEGVKPMQYSDPPIHMAQIGGPAIYLAFGYANYAYRWSFENAVEFGFSPQRLRMMCYCALLNGESALACKYADMLSRFPFHRATARRLSALVNHPELMAQDPLLGQLQPWLLETDALTFDNGKPEKFLIRNLPHTHRVTWHYDTPTELRIY